MRSLVAVGLAAVSLTACRGGGSDAAGAPTPTTIDAAVAEPSPSPSVPSRADAPPSSTSSTSPRAAAGRSFAASVPPPTSSSAFPALPPGEFRFELRRDDKMFQKGPAFIVGKRDASGDSITMTWRWHYDTTTTSATLSKRDGTYVGAHVAPDAGEWPSCQWEPDVVFLPALRPGATASSRSSCMARSDGAREHVHSDVKVVGTRDVSIDGKPHTVWVVERHWVNTTDNTPGSVETSATLLWSPQLEMVVSQEAHTRVQWGLTPQVVNSTFRLLGLDAG